MTEESKLRLFTAVELPQRWKEALGRAGAELGRVGGSEIKPVASNLMHLTLVFLGYQPAASLSAIEAALAAAAADVAPFRLTLGQVGYFGQPHRLQVVWVGLANPPGELERLHQAIGTRLAALRVHFDTKPLAPHITLARMRRPSDRAASLRMHAALQALRVPSGLSMEVSEYVLMESLLSHSGPEYQVVGRFPLTGPPKNPPA